MNDLINEILIYMNMTDINIIFFIKVIILFLYIIFTFCFIDIVIQITKANEERKKQTILLESINKHLISIEIKDKAPKP